MELDNRPLAPVHLDSRRVYLSDLLFPQRSHELVTCRKPTAKAAEGRAEVYARRWGDRDDAGQ